MCGFAGYYTRKKGNHAPLDIVKRMVRTLRHRGPDDSGLWSENSGSMAFGFQRLAILDLGPAGHQPMHSFSGRYVIVFNGEIYNHGELRERLGDGRVADTHRWTNYDRRGTNHQKTKSPLFQWRGHSDTEVFLKGVEEWGLIKTLEMCRGMFAFAIWDRNEKALWLGRDRVGEKPLYYGWADRSLIFASELKALKAYPYFSPKISRPALAQYLRFNCVPAPLSIYQGVFKLEPGHYLKITEKALLSGEVTPECYWSLSEVVVKARSGLGWADPGNDREAEQGLHDQLMRSVREQQVSDVPLGAFLSGGVDSSTIVALMQAQSTRKIKTFTVGFEETDFNEAPFAERVARHLGTDHHELHVSADEAMKTIPLLPLIYDEPFADSSQIPTYWVCKAAKEQVTVALSGDGGDELFGGYNRYAWSTRIWNLFHWMPFELRKAFSALLSYLPTSGLNAAGDALAKKNSRFAVKFLGNKIRKVGTRLSWVRNLEDLYLSLVTEWEEPGLLIAGLDSGCLDFHRENMIQRTTKNASLSCLTNPLKTPPRILNDSREKMMFWDILSYLPDDILCKVDRASMAVSLESRAPFLDHQIVEFAWRLPMEMKIRNGQGKWLLRQVLHRYVPRSLIERPKAGFGIPLAQWLRGPLNKWAEELLDEKIMSREGIFKPRLIQKTWKQHILGEADCSHRLWSILMFQAWLKS